MRRRASSSCESPPGPARLAADRLPELLYSVVGGHICNETWTATCFYLKSSSFTGSNATTTVTSSLLLFTKLLYQERSPTTTQWRICLSYPFRSPFTLVTHILRPMSTLPTVPVFYRTICFRIRHMLGGVWFSLRYISLQLTFLRNSKRKRRNDFYITLESGSFSQDMKNSARNVEINCLFVDADGQLHNCIRRCSTNPVPDIAYNSAVFYHNNTPHYGESFRIDISEVEDQFFSSHILFLIYHCSSNADKEKKSLFAFSVLMLSGHEEGITIADSTFTLPCYAVPEEMKHKDISNFHGVYFDEAVTLVPRTMRVGASFVNESITISSRLFSSSITQDPVLHRLISPLAFANCENAEEMMELFDGCGSLPPQLLLLYTKEILSKCIAALTNTLHYAEPAFRLLILMLDIFNSDAFKNHKHLLDKYINFVFDNHELHRFIFCHVDTVFLWMDYPTIPPNKPLSESVILSFGTIMEIVNQSICNEIKLEASVSEGGCGSYKLNFIESLVKILHRFCIFIGTPSSNEWTKSFKIYIFEQLPRVLSYYFSILFKNSRIHPPPLIF